MLPVEDPDEGKRSLDDYEAGKVPTRNQCEDALKRWLKYHETGDHDKVFQVLKIRLNGKKPEDDPEEGDTYQKWLDELNQSNVDPDVDPESQIRIDFDEMDYEVYKVVKLGGSSREAHTRLYTRTTRSCNIFARYTSFKEGVDCEADGDVLLNYRGLLSGGVYETRGGRSRQSTGVPSPLQVPPPPSSIRPTCILRPDDEQVLTTR